MYLMQLLLISVIICSVTAQCPDGWVKHEQSCYHFSHDTESFIGANAICRDWNSHLVQIGTQAENHFLAGHANSANNRYLIGLTDLQEENVWRWHDSNTEADWTNFRPGEPDNYHSDENCVDLAGDGTWGDLPCHDFKHYICEMPFESPAIVG